MGYSNYDTSFVIGPADKSRPELSSAIFNTTNPSAKSGLSFYSSKSLERQLFSHFCREFLVSDMKQELLKFVLDNPDGRKGFIAFRCFSFMYNDVARVLLEKPENPVIVQNFIRKFFGVSFIISPEISKELTHNYDFRANPFVRLFMEPAEDMRGMLTLYLCSWRKHPKFISPVFISFILGLFRESRIIRAIAEKKITSGWQLVNEIISLAYDRYTLKDNSYRNYGCCSYEHSSRQFVEEQVGKYLVNPKNDDGSDFLSMSMTAFYVAELLTFLPQTAGGDGPVNHARGYNSEERLDVILYKMNENIHRELLDNLMKMLRQSGTDSADWLVVKAAGEVFHEKINKKIS